MARTGVTLADVAAAADQLVAAGERPNTERVRLALGRGSPNTIAPLLEQWWSELGERLNQRLALPELPEAVATAFAETWALAVAAGQAHGEALVAPERAALAQVLASAEQATAQHRADLMALEGRLREAQAAGQGLETALAISEQRANDLQRDLSAQGVALLAMTQQRDAAEARSVAAAERAEVERAAAAKEREELQALLRAVEDRAYGEVDRVRQEVKALKAQLVTQAREHSAALQAGEHARRGAEAALGKAQRDITALQLRLARASKPPKPAKPKATARARKASVKPATHS